MVDHIRFDPVHISTHDLTRRSTTLNFIVLVGLIFQLTTSRGGRHYMPENEVATLHFNSRPHEEVDRHITRLTCLHAISTHDLTRRSTFMIVFLDSLIIFQLTTSRGGRRIVCFTGRKYVDISTHDLTRRSTLDANTAQACDVFQLTTSRGGRQQFLRKKFSFLNHFLCLLHIIYSYYINTIFFSTLFFAKS